MQNISSTLWELIKKKDKSWLSFFNNISAPGQKFKNLVANFFTVNIRSLSGKFQPSSFKTEGGDRE